jgi:uncharacterized repeat protein (TIGR01451 family)
MKKLVSFVASLTMAAVFSNTPTVQAWHPVGSISKTVQNTNALNVAPVEANTDETAVAVKTGDIVRYTITISNKASANNRGYNDLAFIKVTDKVPEGLEAVDNPSQRTISFELDNLVPGKSASKTIDMKVVSKTNKLVVSNEACYTADSLVNDQPQSGCDMAKVRLNIPQTSSTSTIKSEPVVKAVATTTLPKTGVSNVFVTGFGFGIMAYGVSLVRERRKLN